jgi:hypothetical protein
MEREPASLFYWGDFLRDLRRCTHDEAGLWIKCLCLMFESEPKGVLATNGIPWSDEEIASAVGGCNADVTRLVTQLVTKGIASRNADGSLMNRRMYREEKKRDDTRRRVQLHRERSKGNGDVTQPVTHEGEGTIGEGEKCLSIQDKPSQRQKQKLSIDEQVEKIYEAYPRKVGRADALRAIRKAVVCISSGDLRHTPMEPNDARRWLWKRVSEYASSPAGMKLGGEDDMRPHPATWFNKGRFWDDVTEWQKTKNGGSNGNGHYESRADQILNKALRELDSKAADQGRKVAEHHTP